MSDSGQRLSDLIWWFVTGVIIAYAFRILWWLSKAVLLALLMLGVWLRNGCQRLTFQINERNSGGGAPPSEERIMPGEYSADGQLWWSRLSQQWFPCSSEIEHLEIVVGRVDLARRLMAGLTANIFKMPIQLICFKAHANGPSEDYPVREAEFKKFTHVSMEDTHLMGDEYLEKAQERLAWLDQSLVEDGWLRDDVGAHWYSYRYHRPLRLWDSPISIMPNSPFATRRVAPQISPSPSAASQQTSGFAHPQSLSFPQIAAAVHRPSPQTPEDPVTQTQLSEAGKPSNAPTSQEGWVPWDE